MNAFRVILRPGPGAAASIDAVQRVPASAVAMNLLRALFAGSLLWALTLTFHAVIAADYQFRGLEIEDPFARATPPGARSGAVFFSIANTGTSAVRLVGVSSPIADTVELHQMTMENGLMKMRSAPRVEIKPGARLVLEPGGYHVMLTGLKQPLKAGDRFPLRIAFENLGTTEVSVAVESMGAASPTQSDRK